MKTIDVDFSTRLFENSVGGFPTPRLDLLLFSFNEAKKEATPGTPVNVRCILVLSELEKLEKSFGIIPFEYHVITLDQSGEAIFDITQDTNL